MAPECSSKRRNRAPCESATVLKRQKIEVMHPAKTRRCANTRRREGARQGAKLACKERGPKDGSAAGEALRNLPVDALPMFEVVCMTYQCGKRCLLLYQPHCFEHCHEHCYERSCKHSSEHCDEHCYTAASTATSTATSTVTNNASNGQNEHCCYSAAPASVCPKNLSSLPPSLCVEHVSAVCGTAANSLRNREASVDAACGAL